MVGGHATTDVLATTAAPLGADFARPHAPSWLDRIVEWIDRMPGPIWLAYAVLGAIALLWANAVGWLGGVVAVGTADWQQSTYAVFLVFPFALGLWAVTRLMERVP